MVIQVSLILVPVCCGSIFTISIVYKLLQLAQNIGMLINYFTRLCFVTSLCPLNFKWCPMVTLVRKKERKKEGTLGIVERLTYVLCTFTVLCTLVPRGFLAHELVWHEVVKHERTSRHTHYVLWTIQSNEKPCFRFLSQNLTQKPQ